MKIELYDMLKKFGQWIEEEDIVVQCKLKMFGNKCYLNIIQNPLDYKTRKKFDDANKKILNCEYSNELQEIFNHCNGFDLFTESLVLFGIGLPNSSGHYSIDIVDSNNFINIYGFNKKFPDLYAFGSYLNYYFCQKKHNPNEVMVIDKNKLEIIYTFPTIKETYKYYILKLIDEYNEDGLNKSIVNNKNIVLIDNRSTKML